MPKMTIADGMAKPHNNFDLVRLLSCTLILFTHSYSLVQGANHTEPFRNTPLTSVGMLGFIALFIVGGFLITQSYINRHNFIEFLVARILRIFPALLVCLAFCGFIIGPAVTHLSLSQYFRDPELWQFLRLNAILHVYYSLPGVFSDVPIKNFVNGPLWSLKYEFILYLGVAVAGLAGILKRKYLASLICLAIMATFCNFNNIIPGLIFCFTLGALVNFLKDKIILQGRIVILLFAICAITAYLNNKVFLVMFCVTFAYALFWFAYQPHFQEYCITRHGDFSYGIYIYSMPIQQTLMHYFHFRQPWQLTISAFLLSLTIAIFSWRLIERPALRKKRRVHDFLLQLKRQPWLKNSP